jgi:hypothetical protein
MELKAGKQAFVAFLFVLMADIKKAGHSMSGFLFAAR